MSQICDPYEQIRLLHKVIIILAEHNTELEKENKKLRDEIDRLDYKANHSPNGIKIKDVSRWQEFFNKEEKNEQGDCG